MTDKESADVEFHILQVEDQSEFRTIVYRLAKLDPELFLALSKSGVTASILLATRKKS